MMRKIFGFLIILAVALMLNGFSPLAWWNQDGVNAPAFSISEETTKVTGHLDENGFVDYVAALHDLNQLPIDSKDNFALVLWNVIGVDSVPLQQRGAFFVPISYDFESESENEIELDPQSNSEKAALKTFLSGDLRLWRKGRQPKLEDWLGRNANAMEAVKKGVNRTKFAQTYLSTSPADKPAVLGIALYGVSEMQKIARLFATRSMVNRRDGNIQEALDDAFVCRQIGLYLLDRHTEVEIKIGFEICALACKCDKRLVNDSALTLKQASTQLKRIIEAPLKPNFVGTIDKCARWSLLDSLQVQTRKASSQALVQGRINFDDSFKTINQWYDRGIVVINSTPHSSAIKKLDIMYEDLTRLSQMSTRDAAKRSKAKGYGAVLGKILVGQMFSDLRGQYTLMSATQIENKFVLLGYGARIFKLQQGDFPNSLKEVVSIDDLREVDTNAFTEIDCELTSQKLQFDCREVSFVIF